MNLYRPVPVYDPAKGLLHSDHFQVGYVTNDLDRAAAIFRKRFGVSHFRESANDLPGGARVAIRAVWLGNMMYELCYGAGPGMELYTEVAPSEGDFVLRFHHFGVLVSSDDDWAALEAEIARGRWEVVFDSDVPGFFRGCYVRLPELGHFLEFILPREGLLERMNATPVA